MKIRILFGAYVREIVTERAGESSKWCIYIYIYIRCYHYYFISYNFFTLASADGLSLEFEWQQFCPGPQDSTQYSGQSHQFCSLNGLDSYFHVFGKASL